MGQKLNLQLKNSFPLLFQNLSGGEAIYDPLDKDQDVPTILWMENILPTVEGLASAIRSSYITAAIAGGTLQLHYGRVYVVYDAVGACSLYTYTANKHYVYNIAGNSWTDLGTVGTSAAPASVGIVNGISYIFKTGVGVSHFAAGFGSIVADVISGITAASMNGMASALNYAIAWDDYTVYWSAPGNAGQFNPIVADVNTGAGSSRLRDLRGKIKQCYPISGGFIIYGDKNIISARYSGNSINPWIFKEVLNSAGILRPDAVNIDNTADTHFVLTVEGLKALKLDGAEAVFPELTNFLFGFSFYSSNNNGTFTLNTSTYTDVGSVSRKAPLAVKVSYIANRYVCISYGSYSGTVFKFILIFDRVLQRWGQIKVDHVDVFNFIDVKNIAAGSVITNFTGELGKGVIAVMRDGGYVDLIKPTTDATLPADLISSTGEFILGEVKLSRSRWLKIIQFLIHGFKSSTTLNTLTTDTAGQQAAEVSWFNTGTNAKDYFNDMTGISHRIRISGTFNISSVEAIFNDAGGI